MDLEHPSQPLFGTPTPLLKKEPPGYEEAVSQQPRQQVKKVDWGLARVGVCLSCWAGFLQLSPCPPATKLAGR